MSLQFKNLKNSPLYEERYGYKEGWKSTLFYLVLMFVLFSVFIFRGYIVSNYGGVEVSGSSMNITLYSGEELLMKNTDGSDAKRGDVIVVYVGGYDEFHGTGTQYLIKRLIAIEGDKVRCDKGELKICYAGTEQWVRLDEPYAYYGENDKFKNAYSFSEYVVGEGEVFFLGDNRANSCDSRYQEPGGSHLKQLYKRADIVGIVPQWAIKHHRIIEKIFFTSLGGFQSSRETRN